MENYLTAEQLDAGLPGVLASPQDNGVLRAIVVRPASDERVSLAEAVLSPADGVHGDRWGTRCHMTLPDGRSHPDVQITLTNARAIALIARTEARWPLAGDNLYVDLDLSAENLPPGTRLAIGSALLEVTAVPHNGCRKFAQRFGKDAVRFVNTETGKRHHLRGIYARVVEAGTVRVGDVISKR
jgi:MOSC domain-containing protein YiiM